MDSIKVNTDEMRNAASRVDVLADEYRDKYGELYNEVNAFTSTDFIGEDADAFRTKVKEFEDDFEAMKELMHEYASYLRDAAKNYDDTRAKVKQQAEGLQG